MSRGNTGFQSTNASLYRQYIAAPPATANQSAAQDKPNSDRLPKTPRRYTEFQARRCRETEPKKSRCRYDQSTDHLHVLEARIAKSATSEGDQFFLRLLKSNDDLVSRLLSDPPGARPRTLRVARGGNVAALMSSWCSPESSFYKSEKLIPALERESRVFLDAQHPDGTLDAGNLASPPDTAFVVEAIAGALEHRPPRARPAACTHRRDLEQVPAWVWAQLC